MPASMATPPPSDPRSDSARLSETADRELLQAVLDSLADPVVLLEAVRDDSGRCVDFVYRDANRAACEFSASTKAQMVGARMLDIHPGLTGSELPALLAGSIDSGEPLVVNDFVNPRSDDRWYDLRAGRVGDALSLTWRDVTERHVAAHALAVRERDFRLLADNVSDVVMRLQRGVIEWISPSVAATLGGDVNEWLGTKLMHRVHPEDLSSYTDVGGKVREGNVGRWRGRLNSVSDGYRWVEIHAGPYRTTSDAVMGSILSLRVVEDQVAAERELERLARTDPLTGALNRREALERLSAALRNQRRPGPDVAVLYCDVDRFKALNDAYGHAVGDQVLVTLVRRITERLREEDVIARMGGDELPLVLSGIHGIDEAERIAGMVSGCADEPIQVDDISVSTSISIGVTLGGPGEGADSVISRADHEMYRRKAGRAQSAAG